MKTYSKKISWTFTHLVLATILCTGCALTAKHSPFKSAEAPVALTETDITFEATQPPLVLDEKKPAVATPFVHKVRWNGETLAYISKWYTGKYSNWRLLAKANPSIKPDSIFRGNEIVIPNDLLKRHKPMPKDYVAKLAINKKTKAVVPPEKRAPQQADEGKEPLPLFGPKQ